MAGFRDHGLKPVDQLALPHPAVTLLLEFGPRSALIDDAAGQWHGSLVAGLGTGTRRVRGEQIECVQIRLSPLIAASMLGVSLPELSDSVVPLDAVWGREAGWIREQLAETHSWTERFAIVEALLTHRGACRPSVDPELTWAWRRIRSGHGLVRIDALADEIGWTRKRLWSRFHTQFGLPPKRAATLIRFDHAVHRLAAGADPARVAAETGYADQSHLHREIVAFTGITPHAVADESWLAVDDIAWPTTPQHPR
ncbi:helix-turn-helix domain-containing protein [Nocardia sp. CT2-14]|uniref:Helix-turn-helix domain-containing protein n=2 Tax=Nocardia aurantiaca TaxID=2675850 RepID=A0A6I3KZH6_9NOCA|nr:helix-turn-helix domain-containing protein [Nocardia aurantiaca]